MKVKIDVESNKNEPSKIDGYKLSLQLSNDVSVAKILTESEMKFLLKDITQALGYTPIIEKFGCTVEEAKEIKEKIDKDRDCKDCTLKMEECYRCCNVCESPLERDLLKALVKSDIQVELQLRLNKDGEIDGYFNPSSDTLLYNALKDRLVAFGGNGKKAFAEPFFKPRADGTPGAQVRKVKLYSKVTSTVPVHGGNGVADNDTMVRADVYYIPGDGYYWVPIYVADTVKPILPNCAVVAYKSCSEWKEMSEENFLFSLCKNDLVCIESNRPIKLKAANKDSTLEKELTVQRVLAYFEGGNISTGAVSVTTHDNAYIAGSLGFKTLQKVEKYQVDVLGNYTRVKKEKRQLFPAQRR